MRPLPWLRALSLLALTFPLASDFMYCSGNKDLPYPLARTFQSSYLLQNEAFTATGYTTLDRGSWNHATRTVRLRRSVAGRHHLLIELPRFTAAASLDTLYRLSPLDTGAIATLTLLDAPGGPRTYSTRVGGHGILQLYTYESPTSHHVLSGDFRFTAARRLPTGGLDSVIVDYGRYHLTELH